MGRVTDIVPGGERILAKEMACFSARMGGLVQIELRPKSWT